LGLVALEGKAFVIVREGSIEMLKQGLGVTAQDEIHVARSARLLAGSQLHRHASSGDEHNGSVIVYGAALVQGDADLEHNAESFVGF